MPTVWARRSPGHLPSPTRPPMRRRAGPSRWPRSKPGRTIRPTRRIPRVSGAVASVSPLRRPWAATRLRWSNRCQRAARPHRPVRTPDGGGPRLAGLSQRASVVWCPAQGPDAAAGSGATGPRCPAGRRACSRRRPPPPTGPEGTTRRHQDDRQRSPSVRRRIGPERGDKLGPRHGRPAPAQEGARHEAWDDAPARRRVRSSASSRRRAISMKPASIADSAPQLGEAAPCAMPSPQRPLRAS